MGSVTVPCNNTLRANGQAHTTGTVLACKVIVYITNNTTSNMSYILNVNAEGEEVLYCELVRV